MDGILFCIRLKNKPTLSDFYIKTMLAAGTNNGVLALLPRQAKIVLARGTLLVNVGFLVAALTLLQIDILLRLVNEFDEFLVFLLPFVNIS